MTTPAPDAEPFVVGRPRAADPAGVRHLLTVLARARRAHPELRRPLTWSGARAILRRLGIPIVHVPMVRPAALLRQHGCAVLLLNPDTPPRRHTYFVAHELAHFLLGHGADASGGAVYFTDSGREDDPREDDAEDLAVLILGGPRFARHF